MMVFELKKKKKDLASRCKLSPPRYLAAQGKTPAPPWGSPRRRPPQRRGGGHTPLLRLGLGVVTRCWSTVPLKRLIWFVRLEAFRNS